VNRTKSGLYIARTAPAFLRFRAKTTTVTLPNGERAKVTIDDSGTVRHVEHGEHLDATVRPNTIRMVLRPETTGQAVGGFARPNTIRTRAMLPTWRKTNG
jgi:glucose/arabinose dehydrogenase